MDAHRITDPAQLRDLYGAPLQRALDKVRTSFAEPHRRFVARSPFVVIGRAHVSTEPGLLAALAHAGKPAITAIVVEAREIFHQCVRALRRGELWNPGAFVGPDFPKISSTPESAYEGELY